MEDYTGCFNKMDLLLEFCTGPGPAKGPNTTRPADRAGPANMGWSFQRAGPGRRMRGDFSNGPGRAGKKRNDFFDGRVWLQKKEDK